MKKQFLLLLMLISLTCFSQTQYRYQVRANFIPIDQFDYAGAGRFGIETVNRNWNFGLDWLGYNLYHSKSSSYYKDSSLLHMTSNERNTHLGGLAFNVMHKMDFKGNRNKLIFGLQGFVGWTSETNTSRQAVLDTSHNFNYRPGATNNYQWRIEPNSEVVSKPANKLALGMGTFIRFQFEITKRFTFTPELMLPVVFTDISTDLFFVDASFMPGFNFCLGYRFGKVK